MILAFQRWIIIAYEHVPRDMDVICGRTQIFLNDFGIPTLDYLRTQASILGYGCILWTYADIPKLILAFKRWIICA